MFQELRPMKDLASPLGKISFWVIVQNDKLNFAF